MKWEYGGAYKRYPINTGIAVFQDGSMLKCHDIFNPLPGFMKQADLLFTDSPWNKGNLRSFYTKAEADPPETDYEKFYSRLFECIKEINPKTAYCEIGKEYLADFIMEMRNLYKYVTFYNSTYYHSSGNLCYIVRGSEKKVKMPFDNMDEEDIIEWICENEKYDCIADLCMGRGLVAVNAAKNGKMFVGTELNHKRLSVAIEKLTAVGIKYIVKEDKNED